MEGLLARWVRWVAPAELVGFVVPAVVAALAARKPPVVLLLCLVAAGAVEGAVLGAGQAHVLRDVLPAVRPVRWVALTSAGGTVAWLVGMGLPTTADVWTSWPVAPQVVLALLAVLVLLGSIGTAQWAELHPSVPRAWRWVAGTALAWCVGLLSFAGVTSPLWHPGQPVAVIVAIGLLGGAVMATTMAVVTGLVLRRVAVSAAGRAARPQDRRRAPGRPSAAPVR